MEIEVVVEIPARTGNKYEVDHETGELWLDRHLLTAARCPVDYGYVDGTEASDGDPVDALVVLDEPAVPGCHLRARPIAVLWIRTKRRREPKVLCVPVFDELLGWRDLDDVPEKLRRQISQFFETYKEIEDDDISVERWEGRDAAEAALRAPSSGE